MCSFNASKSGFTVTGSARVSGGAPSRAARAERASRLEHDMACSNPPTVLPFYEDLIQSF